MSPQLLLKQISLSVHWKKCSDQQRQNLSVLTELKNSLHRNLSQFSTLMVNKPQMPDTKTTFLPTDKFYMICKIKRVTLPCDSAWPHVYHDVECLFFPTFSTHSSCNFHAYFFFTLKWCCMIFLLSASGMLLSNDWLLQRVSANKKTLFLGAACCFRTIAYCFIHCFIWKLRSVSYIRGFLIRGNLLYLIW